MSPEDKLKRAAIFKKMALQLKSFLGNHPKVLLSEPLNYEEFLFALKNSKNHPLHI